MCRVSASPRAACAGYLQCFPGLAERWAVLCSFSFPKADGIDVAKVPLPKARAFALAQVLLGTGVDIRSTTGFHLLLHVPPPLDLLPQLFGGSPGSGLTVTATFISCSVGK